MPDSTQPLVLIQQARLTFADTRETLESVKREVERSILRLNELEKSIFGPIESTNGHPSTVFPTEFAKMRVSDAICSYLSKTGKPCRLEPDVRDILTQGGCDLGKVPKKAVKLGVVMNPDRLYLDKEAGLVYLREWKN